MNVWRYNDKKFPDQLRQMRKSLGKSQLEFGSSLGLTQELVSLYELGKRQPSIGTLIKIAEALEVDEIRIEVNHGEV